MPNYNGSEYISEAIESVQSQTYQSWELIVVDDGSSDESVSIVKAYTKSDSRIQLVKVKYKKLCKGPAAARKTAIDYANGRFIAFLDSDDLWAPEKLEKQIIFMLQNSFGFSYSWYEIVNEESKGISYMKPPQSKLDYEQSLRYPVIGCLTVIYDTQIVGKVNLDLNQYDPYADYSLWLKIIKCGFNAYCFKEVLAKYRLVNKSLSSGLGTALKHKWNMFRKMEKINFVKSFYLLCFHIFNGFFRKIFYIKSRLK